MALQLLKRNYVMEGYEVPKILKLPQGEVRWAPRRLPVDVGDVMMNMRMDDGKNKYINEHVSKYAQGNNPYGQFGYPYVVNKNNIRPPIIDPKYYQPLSRMPVKFDSVTAGPIVSNLYEKKVEIAKIAPKTISDKVCAAACPRISAKKAETITDNTFHEGEIDLQLKLPHASIPYWPTAPMQLDNGIPNVELDPIITIRPNMGLFAPFQVSNLNQDIELKPDIHVAAPSNPNIPLSEIIPDVTRNSYNLAPKVQSSAWYNPSFNLVRPCSDFDIDVQHFVNEDKAKAAAQFKPGTKLADISREIDVPVHTKLQLHAPQRTNISSRLLKEGDLGTVTLPEIIHPGHFEGKIVAPTIQDHQEFTRTKQGQASQEYFTAKEVARQMPALPHEELERGVNSHIRSRLKIQDNRVERRGLEPQERIIPIGTGRFVQATL